MKNIKIFSLLTACALLLAGCTQSALPEPTQEDNTYQRVTRVALTEPFYTGLQTALEDELRQQLTAYTPDSGADYVESVIARGRFENWLVEGSGLCRLSTYDDIRFTAAVSLLVWTDDTYFAVCTPSLYQGKYVLPQVVDPIDKSNNPVFAAAWDGKTITSAEGGVWLDTDQGFGTIRKVEEAFVLVIGYGGPIEHLEHLTGLGTYMLLARFKL